MVHPSMMGVFVQVVHVYIKLMRLDRGRTEIRSKWYSNRLLIDFSIRIEPSDLLSRQYRFEFGPRLIEFGRFILKTVDLYQKFVNLYR